MPEKGIESVRRSSHAVIYADIMRRVRLIEGMEHCEGSSEVWTTYRRTENDKAWLLVFSALCSVFAAI